MIRFHPCPTTKDICLPDGTAIHPGFSVKTIGHGEEALRLTPNRSSSREVSDSAFTSQPWRFSITIGYDVRGNEPTPITATTASGIPLGVFDIRFPCPFEVFILDLTPAQAHAAASEGIILSSLPQHAGVIRIMTEAPADDGSAHFLPRLYPTPAGDRMAAFHDRLFSLASLHPFSWLEGCVMDGMKAYLYPGNPRTARASKAIEEHWNYFFPNGERLQYCDPSSRPRENVIYGHECCLPFATLELYPPDQRLDYLKGYAQMRNARELLDTGEDDYTTEACYTLAYPAIAAGVHFDDPELVAAGCDIIARRIDRLWQFERLTQSRWGNGTRVFINWGRGIAWMMLGISRSAQHLPEGEFPETLKATFIEIAKWVSQFPREGGLWTCYVDDPQSGQEVSGSCGIAAALTAGVKLGWLDQTYLAIAKETRDAARGFITPEGWMGGVSQINRDGDRLQRQGYRVLSQMGMGLFALADGLIESTDD